MTNIPLLDQIEMLRAQLETALPMPVLLVVSSARSDDGKGMVASGLASSMQAAGYSTLLVLADEQTQDVDAFPEPKSLAELSDRGIGRYAVRAARTHASIIVVPSKKIRHTISREGVTRFSATCRASFQVTIVEVAAVLTNAFAMLMSVAADGVLLTIREGRRVCAEDRQLAKMLVREQAQFLGLVSIQGSAIRDGRPNGTLKPLTAGSAVPTSNRDMSRAPQAV